MINMELQYRMTTPDEFYENLKTISPTCNVYLHTNISLLQYHNDDLRYLIKVVQINSK